MWRHATADVKPRGQKTSLELALDKTSQPEPEKASVPIEKISLTQPVASAVRQEAKAPRVKTALAPLAPLDRRLKKRLSSGRADVDGAIDLHGMTQAQAHQALDSFLWRAAGSGAQIVLVVTGKGDLRPAGDSYAGERGVLRRSVPHWLRAPSLRPIVISVEEAGRPHGGPGALYVRLRRRVHDGSKA